MRLAPYLLAAGLCFAATATAQNRTAGESIDDATLQSRAKAALVGEDFFGGLDINLEVKKGTVQMAGFVESRDQKQRAQELIEGVEGAQDISNRLVVQGEKPSLGQSVDDRVIGTTVNAELAKDEEVDALRINVATRNGVVLLSGFVISDDQKERAGEIASGVANVKDVVNGIDAIPD